MHVVINYKFIKKENCREFITKMFVPVFKKKNFFKHFFLSYAKYLPGINLKPKKILQNKL